MVATSATPSRGTRDRRRALGHVPLSSGEIELYTQQDEAARRRRRLLAVREQERRLAQQVTQRYRANLNKLRGSKALAAQHELSSEQEALLSELYQRYQRSLQGMGTAQRNAREKLLQLVEQAQLEQTKWAYNRRVVGKQRMEDAERAHEADEHARLARRRQVEENLARLRELSGKQRAHASARARKEQEEKLQRAEEAEKAAQLRRQHMPEEVFVTPRPHAKDIVAYQYTRAHCLAAPPAPVATGTSRPAVTVIRHNTRHPTAMHGDEEASKLRDEMDQKRERDRVVKEEHDDKAAGRGEEALRGDLSRRRGQQALEWLALLDRIERRERGQVLGDGEFQRDVVLGTEDDVEHPERRAERAFARMFGLDEDSVELSSFSIETEDEEISVSMEQRRASSVKAPDGEEYKVKLQAARQGKGAELVDGKPSTEDKLKSGGKRFHDQPETPSKSSSAENMETGNFVKAKNGKRAADMSPEETVDQVKRDGYEEEPVDDSPERKTERFAFGHEREHEQWKKTTALSSEHTRGTSGRGESLSASHGSEQHPEADAEDTRGGRHPVGRSVGGVQEGRDDTRNRRDADLQMRRGRDSIEQLETRLQEVLNLRSETSRLSHSSVDSSQHQEHRRPAARTRVETGRHRDLLQEAEMRLSSWNGRGAPTSRPAGNEDKETPNASIVSLPVASIDSVLSLSADSTSLATAGEQHDSSPTQRELRSTREDLAVEDRPLDASAASSRADGRRFATSDSANDGAHEDNSPRSTFDSPTRRFHGQDADSVHGSVPDVASSVASKGEHASPGIREDPSTAAPGPHVLAQTKDDDRADIRSMLSSMSENGEEYDGHGNLSVSSDGSLRTSLGDRSDSGDRQGAGSRTGSFVSHSEMGAPGWARGLSAQQGNAETNYRHEGFPGGATKTSQIGNEARSEHLSVAQEDSDHSLSRRSSTSSHNMIYDEGRETHIPSSGRSSAVREADGSLASSRSSSVLSEQVTAAQSHMNSGRVIQQRFVEKHLLSFSSSEARSEDGRDVDASARRPSVSDDIAPASVKYGPDDIYRQQIEHEARGRSTSSSSIPQYSLPLSDSFSSFDNSFDEIHPGVGEDSFVNELVPLFPKPKMLQQQRDPEGEGEALQQYDVQLDAPKMSQMFTEDRSFASSLTGREHRIDSRQRESTTVGSARRHPTSSQGHDSDDAYSESEQKSAEGDTPSSSRRSSSEASGYKPDSNLLHALGDRESFGSVEPSNRHLNSPRTGNSKQRRVRRPSTGDKSDVQEDEAADVRSERSESDSGVSSLGFSAQLHLAAGIMRRQKNEGEMQRGVPTRNRELSVSEGSEHSEMDVEDDRQSSASEKSFVSGSSLSMDAHFNYLVNMTAAVGKSLPLHLRLPAMIYGKTDMTKPPAPIAWSSSSLSSPAASRVERGSDAHSSSSENLREQIVPQPQSSQRREVVDRERTSELEQSTSVNQLSRSSIGSSASGSEAESDEMITLDAMKHKVAMLPPPPLGSLDMSQPPAPLRHLSGGPQSSLSSVQSAEGSDDTGGQRAGRDASRDLYGEEEHKADDSSSDSGASSYRGDASGASSGTKRQQRSRSSERVVVPMQDADEGGESSQDHQEVSLAEAFQRRYPGFHRRVESHRDRLKRQKEEQRKQQQEQQQEQQQRPPRHPQTARDGSSTRGSNLRGGAADSPLSKQQQELMDRLATGARAKMSSQEMKERSRRLYHQLPEVVERKRQEEALRRRRQRLDELREQEKTRRLQQKERRQRQIQQQQRR